MPPDMGHTAIMMAVMALAFGLIAAGAAVLAVRGLRRRMREKNREIRSLEQMLDLLTRNTDDIFVLFSPEDYKAEYVSPNLERVLGLTAEDISEDMRPLLFGELDSPSMLDGQPPLTEEVLSSIPADGVWSCERDVCHQKTYEMRWFKELLHRCSLDGRERFILMLSDRTQERQMYEALGEALNTARAANDAKSNFLANMSHDIRTPMNAIVGFSVLLDRDAEKPEKVREYTRKITASSQHLLNLINDILDMSKIESGQTTLNAVEFSLPGLVDELYSMMLPQAQAKEQDFELHTKGNLPELLIGDKLRLNQVLINLLSNAVKYTQPGGHIALTVESSPGGLANHTHLCFTVADNGYGMSEAFVEVLFDPFVREVTEATKEIQGTGLGMAITKNIVDLMGGSITVQSKLEQGSTFVIELELAVAEAIEGADKPLRSVPQEEASLEGLRVLAAEDNEINAEILAELLEMEDIHCEIVPNGEAAVERFLRAEPGEFDMIFMDVQMPVMDGYEATRAIRASDHPDAQDIPIIAMTANAFEEDVRTALAAGMNSHTAKPIDMNKLKAVILQLRR